MRGLKGTLALLLASAPLALWAALPACAISLPEEVRLGKQVVAEVRGYGLIEDASLAAIGERLGEVMHRRELPWRFWVVEDLDTYNAFAAPGGFVFITRKYYQKLSDDEAAFVLGHEMAHIDLLHYEKDVKRRRDASLGRLLLGILTDGAAAWSTAVDLGATAYITHYSRVLEREADFAGYRYAQEAGYDARTAVTALSKLGEQPNVHPWIINIYSTHPILSSREDRLAALGQEEPEDVKPPLPSPSHTPDLTGGLEPFDPAVPIAVRILAPEGGRWEGGRRKSFTKLLHLRLGPLGFTIAGDDIMYLPDIGDPVETARRSGARYVLLVTVHQMASATAGPEELSGTPVHATIDVGAAVVATEDRTQVWEGRFADDAEAFDVLPGSRDALYSDTALGALARKVAGGIAVNCAKAAGAKPVSPQP